jgi:hypothetical protein
MERKIDRFLFKKEELLDIMTQIKNEWCFNSLDGR